MSNSKSISQTTIIAVSFIATTGIAFTAILPVLIGSIVDGMALHRSMVGYITFANIFGLTTGATIATIRIGKNSLTKLMYIGCIGLLLFDGLSLFVETGSLMMLVRLMSGVFGGLLYASAMASFSALPNPIHAFSSYIIVYCLISAVSLFALPYFIEAFDFHMGVYFLIIMNLLSLALIPLVRKFETLVKSKSFDSLRSIVFKKEVLISLIAYFFLQLGGGIMFTYSERIGKEAGLGVEMIGIGLSLSALVAFVGAYLVIKQNTRWGQMRPVLIAGLIMMSFMSCLFFSEFAILFIVGLSVVSMAWSFLIPYHQQAQSGHDAFGRVVSIGSIVNMMGRAVGPGIAALVLGDLAFENVLWLAIASVGLGTIAFFSILRIDGR